MGAGTDIPQAWPLLLTREQLCAYLGGLSWGTLSKILPVAPLDLGANVLRYSRPQIDTWAASLPPRLPKDLQHDLKASHDEAAFERVAASDFLADEISSRPAAAVERARQRALRFSGKGQSPWRKSNMSSASSGPTAG